jgi:hypothetical protein
MSCASSLLLVFSLLLSIPVCAQQAQAPDTGSPAVPSQQTELDRALPPVTKDAQAVSVVTQALTAAGGIDAITTISDYLATGSVTYHLDLDHDVHGSVTVRGKGLNQFRLDANLPSGVRSEVTDGLTTIKTEDGQVYRLHSQPPLAPARLALPQLQLRAALRSHGLNLSYKGMVDVDGHPAHDIQVQHFLAGGPNQHGDLSAYRTVDFFVDPSTFQIVMTQDTIPKHIVRQIRYSDFRLVRGMSVPFSISASIHGQNMWLINLTEINFNSGLQDSDFQL